MNPISRFEMTGRQLTFVLVGTMVATGFLSLPRLASAEAGQDAWIGVLLGSIMPLASLILIERLGRTCPNLTMVGMARSLFGRIFGSVLVFAFLAYAVFLSSAVVRGFAEVIRTALLPRTPLSAIVLISVCGIAFVAGRGLKVIARLNELLFLLFLFFALFPLIMLPRVDLTNLLPIGGSGLKGILQAALASSFSYAGIDVLFLVYPLVMHKNEVFRAGLTAVGIVAVMYVTVTLMGVLVFGASTMQHIVWPTIKLFRVLDIQVFERPEIVALSFWVLLGLRPAIIYASSACLALVDLIGLDLKKSYPLLICGWSVVLYIVSQIPRNLAQALEFSTYAGYAFLIFGTAFPAAFLLAALFRREKGKDR